MDERRQRILLTAQQVFSEQGFRSAEVKTIAERAGVGKATIYKFFGSKEALLLTIVQENFNAMRDGALSELLSNQRPLEKLRNITRVIASFLAGNREFSRVIIREAGEFADEMQRQYNALIEQHLPLAEIFFAELRKEGYFTRYNTRDSITMMVNLMIGSTYSYAITGEGNLEQQAMLYLDVLVSGMQRSQA